MHPRCGRSLNRTNNEKLNGVEIYLSLFLWGRGRKPKTKYSIFLSSFRISEVFRNGSFLDEKLFEMRNFARCPYC